MPDEYNIVKMSAGTEYTILLRGDGIALATGLNTNGWLGVGGTATAYTPLELGATSETTIYKNIYDIATGGNHTILLKEDGKAYLIGTGTSGQLGGGNASNITTVPVTAKILKETIVEGETVTEAVELENIVQISAGNATSFAITKEGKVYATGLNTSGQLGLEDRTSPITTFTEVQDETGEGLLQNVVFLTKGPSNTINSGYILKDGTVWASGIGLSGQLGNEEYLDYNNVVKMGVDALKAKEDNIRIQKGNTNQIDISLNLGFNAYSNTSELNKGTLKYESLNTSVASVSSTGLITAVDIGTTKIKITDTVNNLTEYVNVEALQVYNKAKPQILSGHYYTIALKGDRTVWLMGKFNDGPSGDGTSTTNKVIKQPVQLVSPTGEGYVTNAVQIASGVNHNVALLQDGTVIGWGNNDTGECGNNSTGNVVIPEYVVDENGEKIKDIIRIASGGDNTLALTKDGEVYVWGANENGELGTGNTDTLDKPTLISIPGVRIIDVTAGKNYTAFITSDGYVYVSGIVAGVNSKEPVKLERIANVTKAAGGEELIVLTEEGKVIKAGETNTTLYASKDVIDIAAKDGNYMLLNNSGKLYVWGNNSNGELGLGHTSNVSTPKPVEMDKNIISIGAGNNNTYFIEDTGRVYSSGLNTYGALGNDTTDNSSEYVLVGNGEFEVDPDNVLMSENDIVEFKVKSERYNVMY